MSCRRFQRRNEEEFGNLVRLLLLPRMTGSSAEQRRVGRSQGGAEGLGCSSSTSFEGTQSFERRSLGRKIQTRAELPAALRSGSCSVVVEALNRRV